MYIERVVAGPIETNAFVVADAEAKEAIIVDAPPQSASDLLAIVQREGFNVRWVILTHAHFDHIVDTTVVKTGTGAPVVAHEGALPQLQNAAQGDPVQPDRFLKAGETIEVGRYRFQVIETPGHAPGQITIYEAQEQVAFGGDTLFPGGYGRVDLPGSSMEQTSESMRKLLELPDEVTIYPGHGEPTQIGTERGWMSELVEGAS